jgi:hypothetical protein
MSPITQKIFYRNGQLRESVPVRKGRRHGIARTWHKNGVLASQEPYRNGLPHGLCQQWNEAGRLLGKYRMVHGTGIQKQWHENGRLQLEVSTVKGQFCGRNRIWLWDGTLLSERFYLHGRPVEAETYRAAAAKDKTLPKFRTEPTASLLKARNREKYIYQVFVASLLERAKPVEALEWFQKNRGDTTARSLGSFKREQNAKQLVEALYDAGAANVILPGVYHNKAGDQFADCLLVRLPRNDSRRKAIRKICSKLKRRGLGAMQPDADIGESYLYYYFG